ncbi:hypothetical protein L6164_022759 [Bauhinia variegata]|uniref:Uncharacterized protein n=1 Tax=Bauhinia variegata TaxID=167791 RepID=A0ACB9MGT2_BAUVA|nr:hypothetical protein L6164_022759 [Bauhinia variegata]
MSGGCYSKDVKIVIISTQYVETDAKSFKSVVQKLTGKDSDTAPAAEGKVYSGSKTQKERNHQAVFEVPAGGNSFLMRNLSFKEFERMLSEMPSIYELCSDMII